MAKSKSNTSFGMAAEIRAALKENPSLNQRETMDVIKKKFPDATINDNSFGVAFYNARKKLGIPSPGGRKRSKVRIKVPRAAASMPSPRAAIELPVLQAAAKYLAAAGSVEAAIEAVKQVHLLQIK